MQNLCRHLTEMLMIIRMMIIVNIVVICMIDVYVNYNVYVDDITLLFFLIADNVYCFVTIVIAVICERLFLILYKILLLI